MAAQTRLTARISPYGRVRTAGRQIPMRPIQSRTSVWNAFVEAYGEIMRAGATRLPLLPTGPVSR